MKIRDCLIVAALLAASTAAIAQEVAGRVLVAAGDVSIERGQQRIAARAGTEVRAGDLFQVGPQASTQIRLTDESIIALRGDTTFRVTEYSYQNRTAAEQRSFFELVKGGMRTVTGIIGRVNQRNYGVTTPTATIGIRGTHYSLFQSPPEAQKRSGLGVQVASLAADAGAGAELQAQAGAPQSAGNGQLFGSVTDGVIAVKPLNSPNTTTFGADQYFRLDGPGTEPQRLLVPPAQLAQVTRPAGRAAPATGAATGASGGSTGGETETTVAQTGQGGGTGDSRVSPAVTSPTAPLTLNPAVFQATEAATASSFGAVVQPTGGTGTVFYRLDGGVVLPANDGSFVTVDFLNVGVNLGLGVARVSMGIRGDDNGRLNLSTPRDVAVQNVGGQLTFSTTVNRSDFPFNQSSFRCQTCGPGGSVGFADSLSVTGTISGSTVTVSIAVTDAGGGGGFTASVPQIVPPNDLAAAMVVPRLGGGANTMVTTTHGITLDGAGKPTQLSNGQMLAQVGGATNTQVGFDPAAGNLRWGMWNGASNIVRDANYNPLTGNFEPWIVGQFPNTVPTTLGTVSYTPVGSIINAGNAMLNSAMLTADFVNRSMAISLSVTRTAGELNTFSMSGTSVFSPITATFGAGFSSVSCSGPCVSGGNPIGGSFGGFFSGPNAEGAGVAYTAGFGVGNGVTGVTAFKR